jgi:hypothetical protein
MTPTELRAEAEKMAFDLRGDCSCATCLAKRVKIADDLIDFAQRHAEFYGKLERLRGKIDALGSARWGEHQGGYDIDAEISDYRQELAALEKGEEVAG